MSSAREQGPDARLVRVEIEVPGTPEQVWEAIATGPGIAAWFVPAEVEEREGGAITTHHGAYGDSTGVVTAWEPPVRFAYEERDWEEGAPPWVTEITIEPKGGGTCVVRLVSGLYSDGADWADQIDPTEAGWLDGLGNLRIYLSHFAGQSTSSAIVTVATSASPREAWAAVAGPLGLESPAVGDRVQSQAGAPPLRGVVERVGDEGSASLRSERPAPGVVSLNAYPVGDATHVTFRAHLYGEEGAAAAGEQEGLWRAWLEERLPDGADAGGARVGTGTDHDKRSADSFPSSDPPATGGPGI